MYTPLALACRFGVALRKSFFVRPSISAIILVSLLRKADELRGIPFADGRRPTGDALICLPRVKVTVYEVLSLAPETQLSELAKLDVTRETLISVRVMRSEEEDERITTVSRHKAQNMLTKESARVGRCIYLPGRIQGS